MDYEKIGRRTVELLEALASFVEAWRACRDEGAGEELEHVRVLVVEIGAELAPALRDRVLRAIPMEPAEVEALARAFPDPWGFDT